jgi:bacillolysin
MKKLIFLALVFFTVQLDAQFKKVEKGPKSSTSSKVERIANPLSLKSNGTENDHVEFLPKGLTKIALKASLEGFTVLASDKNGLPLAIEGIAKSAGNRNMSIEDRALLHLKELKPILGLSRSDDEFSITSVNADELGNKHIRVAQNWNGIPVYGAELILHTQNDAIDFVNGRYKVKPQELETKPTLSSKSAIDEVTADLGSIQDLSKLDKKIFSLDQSKSELVYFDFEGKIFLAYHITYYKNLVERWEYFISAADGSIIKKHTSICKFHHGLGKKCNHGSEEKHEAVSSEYNNKNAMMDGPATANALDLFNVSRAINTYQKGASFFMIDAVRPMFKPSSVMPDDPVGAIWTIDGFNTSPQKDNFNYDHVKSTNNSWSSKTAVSAHYNGGKAYEYFKDLHSRNSINGSGGNIISFINVADEDGASMGNAFWNGQAMFYGNGDSSFKPLAKGLDVAGHEMCHGVVQNTANLEYEGESGALNESFADVFGSLIDRDDWLIGEDVVLTSAFPSGALRSLSDPHNGAAKNQFNDGWQPRIYSERFTGSQDNGGVHINSGIPNWAYFLFASNPSVGKDKAEKIYYRALTSYLTKSSQFVDARIAVVRAAKELYNETIANIATAAFDQVEIPGGSGGTYQTDVNKNPGQDLILFTDNSKQDLFIYSADGAPVANPLSNKTVISKPSITDDGSFIVFISGDKKISYIDIDWAKGTSTENSFDTGTSQWRNVAVSKDGTKISALRFAEENKMMVFDLITGDGNEFELTNPTFSDGVSTGEVLYADAMEWDFTGESVMYDAENEVKSNTAGTINYWDIGFIRVWNNKAKSFSLGKIEKLFPSLEEGESVGNPTFSKNSPYIIAFDYLMNNKWSILGANTETGKIGVIASNDVPGYPSFSKVDDKILFETNDGVKDLNVVKLKANKIEGDVNSIAEFSPSSRWGVWFSNGTRVISSIEQIDEDLTSNFTLQPNPATTDLNLSFETKLRGTVNVQILDATGRIIKTSIDRAISGKNTLSVNVTDINKGIYFVKLNIENKELVTAKFVKF